MRSDSSTTLNSTKKNKTLSLKSIENTDIDSANSQKTSMLIKDRCFTDAVTLGLKS